MKALWIPLALLTALLLFALWAEARTDRHVAALTEYVRMADRAVSRESWQQAHRHLTSAQTVWSEVSPLFHIIIRHQELEDVAVSLAQTETALQLQDVAQSRLLLQQLAQQLRRLADTQAVSIKNIL